MQEVDKEGLDKQDRRYLETLIRVFNGGPTGVEALAATMNVSVDTLKDEVEPYLLRREYVVRSPRGREVTSKGYLHLGLPESHRGPVLPLIRPAAPGSSREHRCESRGCGVAGIQLSVFVLARTRNLEFATRRDPSGRVARSKRSRTACHSGESGGMITTIDSRPSESQRWKTS